MTKKKTFI